MTQKQVKNAIANSIISIDWQWRIEDRKCDEKVEGSKNKRRLIQLGVWIETNSKTFSRHVEIGGTSIQFLHLLSLSNWQCWFSINYSIGCSDSLWQQLNFSLFYNSTNHQIRHDSSGSIDWPIWKINGVMSVANFWGRGIVGNCFWKNWNNFVSHFRTVFCCTAFEKFAQLFPLWTLQFQDRTIASAPTSHRVKQPI